MRNRHPRGRRAARGSWRRIGPFSKNWSHKTPISHSSSCAMRWPMRRACGCTTPRLPIFYPGSGSPAKKSLAATERRRAKVGQQRADWFRHRRPASAALPDRAVFIDETAVKTNLTRLRGRARRGARLTRDAPLGSWGTQTLIAGLTQDALIAPWVIEGAMDGPAFAACIREVPVPEVTPGTVVILDNLATHRNREAAQALRDHGCRFLCLPPYSPDLNPIGQAFSKPKAHLRRIGARPFTEVFEAIGSICELHDPTECSNYFKAAGHLSG